MKEKLQSAAGSLGIIIWYVLSSASVIVPIMATHLPIWTCIIIFAIIYFTGIIGAFVSLTVYGYSFYVMLHHPFGAFWVAYLICLIFYVLFMLIPTIVQIVSKNEKSLE